MTFVTCIEQIEPCSWDPTMPILGDKRTWGVMENWEEAVQALHENWFYMHEDRYSFAVIEECDFGIFPRMNRTQFFQWNAERKGFFEIETPSLCQNICNFAIG